MKTVATFNPSLTGRRPLLTDFVLGWFNRTAIFVTSTNQEINMGDQSNKNQRAWVGVVLVTLGAYFLLRNFNLIPYFLPYWLFDWEMILIIVGGAMLATGRREGFVFLAIGAFFLLPDIFNLPRFRMRDWWPVILIIVGLVIFLRRRDHWSPWSSSEVNSDYFEDTAIFGGSSKFFTSKSFQGGKITSIFGGSDIDFSEAELGKEEVVLDVLCLFGGNDIRVPSDWTVINESFVLFGGFDDKRRAGAYTERDPNKVFRIRGAIIFGGMDVKGI